MFEEICLTCSKRLPDDSRAYCSDECEAHDTFNSPAISTASSVLSSPSLDCAIGDDVPALLPSALGADLSAFTKRVRYSASSSSTSSASWSVFTDADDDEALVSIGEDAGCDGERPDVSLDAISCLAGVHLPGKSSSLNYTRRPSATNHRSLIPMLHSRTPSMSSFTGTQNTSSTEDDLVDGAHRAPQSYGETAAVDHDHEMDKSTIGSKSRKSRNRASLPAYFSLLQINAPRRSPLRMSSPDNASHINQPSPPTPKLASLLAVSGLRAVEATPRGRLRDPGISRSRRRSQSRSRSRSRVCQNTSLLMQRARQDSRSNVEPVFDWSCSPVSRGRTVRRNSSPLPKMMLSMQEFEDPALIAGPISYLDERRGRYRVHELDSSAMRGGQVHQKDRGGFRERGRAPATRW
ncbi:hypothetical protein SCLCIDRAFT_1212535 [Scleroderma citrinum Foug A]|uniref:Uncharacterized protein n=1 Tax=Scleroderma citrinum Foug A TaxID=1036808 RepID=A0A0C2ZV43_9AGAM|nr:hypothetical protein SCLCIDRAFT_1212535 [Scleroderma citrinum Foug A]